MSRYLTFLLSGLVEVPSYVVSPFLLDLLGRRGFVSLAHLLTACSFLGVIFVGSSASGGPLGVGLWLLGKFGIACSLTALFVFASEVFPTSVRSGCIGFCAVLGRAGGAASPFIRSLVSRGLCLINALLRTRRRPCTPSCRTYSS